MKTMPFFFCGFIFLFEIYRTDELMQQQQKKNIEET